MKTFSHIALCLLLASFCSACQQEALTPSLNETFTLKIGESANIKDTHLRVEVASVSEDSRCPTNATCFWVGQVVVEVGLWEHDLGGTFSLKLLNTGESDQPDSEYQFGDFQVRLLKVDPYPDAFDSINEKDYKIQLQVIRN